MDRGYRYLEHMSDLYIEAYGANLEEAFEEAAKATFNAITDLNNVSPLIMKEIIIEGFDEYSLLYNWIEKLLQIFEIENFIPCIFNIKKISKKEDKIFLEAIIKGEEFNYEKHTHGIGIKSMTYALMEIIYEKNKVIVRFLLDI
jgi:SHS2 domain-containing protein